MVSFGRARCHECGAKVPRGTVRCEACTPKADTELALRDRMLGIITPFPTDESRS